MYVHTIMIKIYDTEYICKYNHAQNKAPQAYREPLHCLIVNLHKTIEKNLQLHLRVYGIFFFFLTALLTQYTL